MQCFEASARHLSFTRAGDELNLTQSAVSKQVAQMELVLPSPVPPCAQAPADHFLGLTLSNRSAQDTRPGGDVDSLHAVLRG
ncbi:MULTISPECIES: LysR family transcriptional regulator [unclassified Halomonas]|uniref:LysR family transcriptional regulator n=1 Tax=Halomonas sp. N3-2A TaxID=2014541 RepID=UPI002FCA2F5E